MRYQRDVCWLVLVTVLSVFADRVHGEADRGRWSAERANAWYADIDWPVGTNFVPSTAINQLEMWQAETFDPVTIDRELGWAAKSGSSSSSRTPPTPRPSSRWSASEAVAATR